MVEQAIAVQPQREATDEVGVGHQHTLGATFGALNVDLEPVLLIDDGDDHGAAARQLVRQCLLEPAVHLRAGELADHTTEANSGGDSNPTSTPTLPPHVMPRRPRWSAVWVTHTSP